jgi:endonuclease V-like protein UPF0215 family
MKVALKRLRTVKPEIRVLGIDGPKHVYKETTRIFGVVLRGCLWLDGVMYTSIRKNGIDSTEKIIKMVRHSSHYGQIRVLMIHGLAFAGCNLVNIKHLYQKLMKPVIVFSEHPLRKINFTPKIKNLQHSRDRLNALEQAGDPIPIKLADGCKPSYIQISGITPQDAEKVLNLKTRESCIPEPLRIASLASSAYEQSFRIDYPKRLN